MILIVYDITSIFEPGLNELIHAAAFHSGI